MTGAWNATILDAASGPKDGGCRPVDGHRKANDRGSTSQNNFNGKGKLKKDYIQIDNNFNGNRAHHTRHIINNYHGRQHDENDVPWPDSCGAESVFAIRVRAWFARAYKDRFN